MTESSQQPVSETTQALQSSTLNQRLDRRRTEPSGIVDVRPFNSQFARVPGWIVQRSVLLDQIHRRYSSQDDASADEADMVLAAPSQPVPREQTLSLPTAEQTAAPSTVAFAKPVTPTTTSDSPPSGQFRVSRKAIPLAKVDAIASSQTDSSQLPPKRNPAHPNSTKTISSSNEPSNQRLVTGEPGFSQSIETSIQIPNQPPVASEIASTQDISQLPEQSLILPKRINQETSASADSGAVNLSNSSQSITKQSSFREKTPGQNVSKSPDITSENQPSVVEGIFLKLPPPQGEQSLVLSKRLFQKTSASAGSGAVNLSNSSPTSTEPASLRENSPQQKVSKSPDITPQNQPPVVGEITQKLQPFQQTEPDFILPKRLNQDSSPSSDSGAVNLSDSSQSGTEQSSFRENSPQQDVAIASQKVTQNQLPLVGKIFQKLQPLQQVLPDLILPKRLNQENSPSSDSNSINFSDSSQTGSEPSSLRGNSFQQETSIPQEPVTQKPPPVVGEIARVLQPSQQASLDLILPKRINQDNFPSSNSGAANLVPSSQTPIEQSSVRENSPQPKASINPENPTQNQRPVVGEISHQLQRSPQASPYLILPKRLNPETSPGSNSSSVNLSYSSQTGTQQSSLRKNALQQEASIRQEPATQNQPSIVGEIARVLQPSQQASLDLILPKRVNQETSLPSTSNVSAELPSIVSEISQPSSQTRAEMPLVMRDVSGRVDESLKEFTITSGQSDLIGRTPLAIASEIPVTANSTGQQNMIWRKSSSTTTSGNSLSKVTNSNTQSSLPLAISPASVQGQIAREPFVTSNPSSFATPEMGNGMSASTQPTPVQTTTPVREVNVAQIAEQVSRILQRQLTVERERRGMNLWY